LTLRSPEKQKTKLDTAKPCKKQSLTLRSPVTLRSPDTAKPKKQSLTLRSPPPGRRPRMVCRAEHHASCPPRGARGRRPLARAVRGSRLTGATVRHVWSDALRMERDILLPWWPRLPPLGSAAARPWRTPTDLPPPRPNLISQRLNVGKRTVFGIPLQGNFRISLSNRSSGSVK
jgi:hypothetical protein